MTRIVDPAGRLADLARHVAEEASAIERDASLESNYNVHGSTRMRAMQLRVLAQAIAQQFEGHTEMPDAKRQREGSTS
jgi:hypothetical protein